MKFRKSIAIFSIVVGIAIIVTWIIQLTTGQAKEFETTPIEITLAITADWVTAAALIISGIGLLLNCYWAFTLYLFSSGMLVYSLVISSGYFGESGDLIFVILFAILLILSGLFIFTNVFKKNNLRVKPYSSKKESNLTR